VGGEAGGGGQGRAILEPREARPRRAFDFARQLDLLALLQLGVGQRHNHLWWRG